MPEKTLDQLVRDGAFRARRHGPLLASDDLPWPAFAELQQHYRDCGNEFEQKALALKFERLVREAHEQASAAGIPDVDLQDALADLGEPGSPEQVIAFFEHFLRLENGEPFVLEPWQQAFIREFYRRTADGQRVYKTALLGIPRGNGKTPLAAGLGLHTLLTAPERPRVFQIAGDKTQAGLGVEFIDGWLDADDSDLSAWVRATKNVVTCKPNGGRFRVLSSEGKLAHGRKPSAGIIDELWLFRHAREVQAYTGLRTALHKIPDSWLLAISTAGYGKESKLAEIYDSAIGREAESLEGGCLTVVRNEAGRALLWWYGAPASANPDDPDIAEVLRRCNPGSWVDVDALLADRDADDYDELEWRRLHLNQWTATRRAWFASGIWDRMRSGTQIPDGEGIVVGIDAARSFDTTAVGWAWASPAGKKVLRSHVWSVRRTVPHHTFVEGGELVNEELVEPYIDALGERYRIRAILFDPRYFSAEARHLANKGYTVIEVQPQSSVMGDAVVQFEKDGLGANLEHDGDRVLAKHIDAIDADRRPDGSKKIGKRSEGQPIDAGISVILANYGTTLDLPEELEEPLFAWR